ncbi:endonuclease/exonuclease/phosphatase family protein [Dictyocaulus viviparus]|uniref:inositol-polyphosphate 5-phosphatase n=1 Tax=Dictyocaulus viviparus TaxID=29172 RepID=A0A0D8XME3_DICVI|nr:endonuclease/exonuclease/phosphatase family protein [Dictyocaulus viviparus]
MYYQQFRPLVECPSAYESASEKDIAYNSECWLTFRSEMQTSRNVVADGDSDSYVECAWQVPKLIKELASRLPKYSSIRAYLDLEHEAPSFTALGSVVLVRDTFVGCISQFDFLNNSYVTVEKGMHILIDGLGECPVIVKKKFPKHFWPTIKWGRKGFMQTRWKVNNLIFDFVNVHLFHDESNLALIHENPLLYSSNRKRALDYVLEQLSCSDKMCYSLQFIFGDFNFRLDSPSFLNRLTERASLHPLNEQHGSVSGGLQTNSGVAASDQLRRVVSAVEFRRESNDDLNSGFVLRIEKKRFDYFNHTKLLNDWRSYLEDDREAKNFEQLHELPINFPPTYPWSENPEESDVMMKTRAPAWCDRILMNASAFNIVRAGNPVYSSFGKGICTGDHKPVALAFSLDL